ncbi:uncharacterized protein [Clytia hemisphaerica]|uniref:uncharacterized protein n=1 Tax=Clytia hemisphaerica TaxID=252671 RepID=UPI0034D513C2
MRIPSGKKHGQEKWRKDMLNIITKDRVVDARFQAMIDKNNVFICGLHFREEDLYHYVRNTVIRENCLPTLNLPSKIGRKTSGVERSMSSIDKRAEYQEALDSIPVPQPAPCYSGLDEFKIRVGKLKLDSNWQMRESNNYVEMSYKDSKYIIPKYQIFIQDDLTYKIRCYGWLLPSQNPIHDACGSFKNMTFSKFILLLKEFNLCEGKLYNLIDLSDYAVVILQSSN